MCSNTFTGTLEREKRLTLNEKLLHSHHYTLAAIVNDCPGMHIFHKCAIECEKHTMTTGLDKVLLMENVKPLSTFDVQSMFNTCTFNKLKQANVLKKYIIECIYVYIYIAY